MQIDVYNLDYYHALSQHNIHVLSQHGPLPSEHMHARALTRGPALGPPISYPPHTYTQQIGSCIQVPQTAPLLDTIYDLEILGE